MYARDPIAPCRRRSVVGKVVLATGVLTLFLGALPFFDDDVRRAYPSPEYHKGVDILLRGLAIPTEPAIARTPQDFDGDGVVDQFSVEYMCLRPLFRRGTSGMVRVLSGADASLLLAHAVATPLHDAAWCGDVDGNGTDDLLVKDGPESCVLGRAR